ncbi:hypothetical protein, partial [Kaistia sp. MMO-174]|uniref:hypothetical protein n=1 Tax=Kaistia sp. MMO-174 TaxID=3081256 RepID=UPI00301A53EA
SLYDETIKNPAALQSRRGFCIQNKNTHNEERRTAARTSSQEIPPKGQRRAAGPVAEGEADLQA